MRRKISMQQMRQVYRWWRQAATKTEGFVLSRPFHDKALKWTGHGIVLTGEEIARHICPVPRPFAFFANGRETSTLDRPRPSGATEASRKACYS